MASIRGETNKERLSRYKKSRSKQRVGWGDVSKSMKIEMSIAAIL